MTGRLRVLAKPARGMLNPHLDLLYEGIRDRGAEVAAFGLREGLRRPVSVIHFHWPEHQFPARHRTPPRRFLKALVTLAVIRWARLRGARLVWTAHNLRPHNDPPGAKMSWLMRRFLGQVDGVIHLSETGRRQAARSFPRLATVVTDVIPRGGYRESYPENVFTEEARVALGLDPGAVVLCFFGRIRMYKGLDDLVEALRALPDDDVTLLVAGDVRSEPLGELLREAADRDGRIRLTLRNVEPEEVRAYIAASDLVVLPYKDVLHSGAAVLALSFATPVLAPALGSFPELRAKYGAHWVRLYQGRLTTDVLGRHVAALRVADSELPPPPPLPAWSDVAQQTIEFYLAIGARPR